MLIHKIWYESCPPSLPHPLHAPPAFLPWFPQHSTLPWIRLSHLLTWSCRPPPAPFEAHLLGKDHSLTIHNSHSLNLFNPPIIGQRSLPRSHILLPSHFLFTYILPYIGLERTSWAIIWQFCSIPAQWVSWLDWK